MIFKAIQIWAILIIGATTLDMTLYSFFAKHIFVSEPPEIFAIRFGLCTISMVTIMISWVEGEGIFEKKYKN